MAYVNPDEDDFKEYFVRDFPYGSADTQVMDSDITRALGVAAFNFNSALYSSQTEYTLGFLLLTAHYLVTNLRNSSQGIAGNYSFLEASKSVGPIAQSFSIPQRVLDDPQLAMLAKTTYGAEFLQLILPRLIGQIFSVCGGTNP